jgi:hypothetical protein
MLTAIRIQDDNNYVPLSTDDIENGNANIVNNNDDLYNFFSIFKFFIKFFIMVFAIIMICYLITK